jgi:ribokinase
MKDLLIIGGASLDTLHFGGKRARSAGGAGMYTAAAASCLGAATTMFAPRPDPMPAALQPLDARVEWIGPTVGPEELPHFEIAHYGEGRAELLHATWGKEATLDPGHLPEDLSDFRVVHIAAVGTAEHQLFFLEACRQRGARYISIGTYARIVYGETDIVHRLFESADLFFMNENEARGLFGAPESAQTSPGKLLFVTLGKDGAIVIQGYHRSRLPAPQIRELDPTGAGDSFCGATLAGLTQGMHPILAARKGVALASHMITAVGPEALWAEDPAPQGTEDPRVKLDRSQLNLVADQIASLPEVRPFDFVGPGLPAAGHPVALDYFFAATLQQFGFWTSAMEAYEAPMVATIDGQQAKGSDYLWRAYLRRLEDGDFYSPGHQADLSQAEMREMFRADDGSHPLPALELHLSQARAYGGDMLSLGLSPQAIVARANASRRPLKSFLRTMDQVGGYKEDPLRKKSVLLAMILAQRPERFLQIGSDEHVPPVIDYHLMRSCLRIGLLGIVEAELDAKLRARQLLEPEEEWAVRYAAYEAIQALAERSGKSMGAVDWFFFNARRRCPEMTEPDCAHCQVDPVCAHRKELFQPVIRTSFY